MTSGSKDYGEMHYSVLLNELIWAIDIFTDKQNIVVDCTLGLAGHACEIIKKLNSWDIFVWFDADIANLELAEKRIEALWRSDVKIILINSNYVHLKEELSSRWIDKITWIYFDLGLSSLHVDEADRWFSFRFEGPLDMRFDRTEWKTAADIVNRYRRDDLVRIIKEYWEEPQVNKIATAIVEARTKKKFETTLELKEVIDSVASHPKAKTRIFQALRIEVNEEIDNLKIALDNAISILDKDWIIFVISFHSLEDRVTKQIFKKESRWCYCKDLICSCRHEKQLKILTKKPIEPTDEEVKINSRSRSAKARYAQKI